MKICLKIYNLALKREPSGPSLFRKSLNKILLVSKRIADEEVKKKNI